jgi:hypothetical protein
MGGRRMTSEQFSAASAHAAASKFQPSNLHSPRAWRGTLGVVGIELLAGLRASAARLTPAASTGPAGAGQSGGLPVISPSRP